jgi:hypothetical protein
MALKVRAEAIEPDEASAEVDLSTLMAVVGLSAAPRTDGGVIVTGIGITRYTCSHAPPTHATTRRPRRCGASSGVALRWVRFAN